MTRKKLDPRWQRKRLEIMQRDRWSCMNCDAVSQTLHVHHMRYDGDPWETPASWLQTLCEHCHEALGKHPKGGIWWFHGTLCFAHCPMCGSEARLQGSYVDCAECDYSLPHPAFENADLPFLAAPGVEKPSFAFMGPVPADFRMPEDPAWTVVASWDYGPYEFVSLVASERENPRPRPLSWPSANTSLTA